MNKFIIALAFIMTACGPQGKQGPAGESIVGEKGEKGDSGNAGIPGSVVSYVLPCPSVVAAFPEVLLCIDNNLYAVYASVSTNKVHLTLLSPGIFNTTDGRSCQFEVVTGCEIR